MFRLWRQLPEALQARVVDACDPITKAMLRRSARQEAELVGPVSSWDLAAEACTRVHEWHERPGLGGMDSLRTALQDVGAPHAGRPDATNLFWVSMSTKTSIRHDGVDTKEDVILRFMHSQPFAVAASWVKSERDHGDSVSSVERSRRMFITNCYYPLESYHDDGVTINEPEECMFMVEVRDSGSWQTRIQFISMVAESTVCVLMPCFRVICNRRNPETLPCL